MTGRDFDTDPSTPGAIRGAAEADAVATAATDPIDGSAAAATRKPNTDPGLGPAAPPAKPSGRQDSVEMLLDGMGAPQPERPKTTPRTEGEASASYHAEHPVHPARTEPDAVEPKVIVERPVLAPTVKVDRAKLQLHIEAAEAKRRAEEAEAAAKAPVPVTLGPRLLIAAVAGLVVVLAIFLVARGKSSEASDEQGSVTGVTPAVTATATGTATTAAAPTVTAPATAAPIPVADTDEPAATAPSHPTPTANVPVSALPVAPAAPKPRPRPTSTSGDLGEFKSTFH